MFIEQLLGNSSKVKILRALVEKNAAMSLYDLAHDTLLSIGIIHKELLVLKKLGIVFVPLKERKQEFYRINPENKYYHALKDTYRIEKEADRSDKVYLQVWNMLEILTKRLTAEFENISGIFLFGSMASGLARYNSYIDILVIVKKKFQDEKPILKEVKEINRKVKNRISISFASFEEFNDGKLPLISEVKKKGIRLW